MPRDYPARRPPRRSRPRPRSPLNRVVGNLVRQEQQQPVQQPEQANPYDLTTDPILQRTRALGQQSVADAEAEALRLRKQLAIDYGDEAYAGTLDEATRAAAAANPYSARKKLAEAKQRRPKELDEQLGANLFYSGHRAVKQSDLSRALLEDEATAGRSFRDALGGIESGLLGARRSAAERETEGLEGAAGRRQGMLGDLDLGGPALGSVGGVVRGLLPRRQPRPRRPRPSRAIYE